MKEMRTVFSRHTVAIDLEILSRYVAKNYMCNYI